MANKVFRAHKTGVSKEDWFTSAQISKSQIDEILAQDMAGTKQPTSIPSPFARIDLVRVAFEKVAESTPDGKTDAHQLVSDALDIGQIFFNFERHQSNLSITRWERKTEIKRLKESGSESHVHLAKTFDLYLKQDGQQYNFDRLKNIFILKYKHNVIGGTSPRTLFFAAPRASQKHVDIIFENDRVLDNDPLALYKREASFIRYMFGLRDSVSDFSILYPEVSKYMDANLRKLQDENYELYNDINKGELNFDDLADLHIPGNEGVIVDILPGSVVKMAAKANPDRSDFLIDSSKNLDQVPMALPVGPFTKNWMYTSASWNPDTRVNHHYSEGIEERTLPDQGIKYPFITQNDLLAPTIVKLPYPIDSEHFLTAGSTNFILPLTKTFFKYFTSKDLLSNKVKISIEESESYGGITTVRLDIPVKGNKYITYRKKYEVQDQAVSSFSEKSKNGLVVDASIVLAFTPFFISSNEAPHYFSCCSTDPNQPYDIRVYANGLDDVIKTQENLRSNISSRQSTHYRTEQRFDLLEMSIDGRSGFIIPKWKNASHGNVKHSFAIDFGTTNTHIEYKTDSSILSQPIQFKVNDDLIVFLRNRKAEQKRVPAIIDAEDVLKHESLPLEIHNSATHSFPIRTVLFENEDVNYQRNNLVFTHANIGFDYEKRSTRRHLRVKTELKWSDLRNESNRQRILRFLEELFMICRARVIADGGNENETSFNWFFPISMTGAHKNKLAGIWKEAFKNVFKNASTDNLKEVSESIAPFFYYHKQGGITALAAPAVSIDIGGETSDVVILSEAKPTVISSFRFAGNSIFGDGLNQNPSNNGFVNLFKEKYKQKIEENEIFNVFDEHFKVDRSSDLVNFLFSLSNNDLVKEKEAPINFEQELKENEELKIVFLLFFSALFYHVAQLCKENGLQKPRNFLFSGRGSKTLFILNGDDTKLKEVEKLLSTVFDFFYPDDSGKIEISIAPNPKEITSKGGLLSTDVGDLEPKIQYHLGGMDIAKIQKPYSLGLESLNFDDYELRKEDYLKDILSNLDKFFELIESFNQQGSIFLAFGISPTSRQILKNIITDHQMLQNFIQLGVKRQLEDVGDKKSTFEETLFFYPIIGVLNKLAFEISKTVKN